MKRLLCIAALACTAGTAFAADVSVNIGVPGVFGRIDLGGFPPPQLINQQPVYIQRDPSREAPAPIYLHVPPDHARNWRRYCGQYNACGQPVFFVQDNWYRNVYTPHYREMQRRGPDGRGDDHRGDDRRGDDRGPRGRDDQGGNDDRGNGRGRDGR